MPSFSCDVRLKKKQDFEAVFAKPRRSPYRYFLALTLPNQQPLARIGIMLAKRHIPLAVHRNRVRRVIRESFRHHQDALKGLDIVVLLRSKWSPSMDNHVLREDIAHLWQKLLHS